MKYDGRIYWEDNSLRTLEYGEVLAKKPGLLIAAIKGDPEHHHIVVSDRGFLAATYIMSEPGYRSGETPGDFSTAVLEGKEILEDDSIRILNEITTDNGKEIVIDQINPLSEDVDTYDLRVGFDPDNAYKDPYPWGFFDKVDGKLVFCFKVQDFSHKKVVDNPDKKFPYRAVVVPEDQLNDELKSILN